MGALEYPAKSVSKVVRFNVGTGLRMPVTRKPQRVEYCWVHIEFDILLVIWIEVHLFGEMLNEVYNG